MNGPISSLTNSLQKKVLKENVDFYEGQLFSIIYSCFTIWVTFVYPLRKRLAISACAMVKVAKSAQGF